MPGHGGSSEGSVRELVGGRLQITFREEIGTPTETVCVWVADGVRVSHLVELPPENVAEMSLTFALEHLGDRKIERVRVADRALAEAAEALLPDVPRVLGETPEVEAVREEVDRYFNPPPIEPRPYPVDAVGEAVVRRFFEAVQTLTGAVDLDRGRGRQWFFALWAPQWGLEEALVALHPEEEDEAIATLHLPADGPESKSLPIAVSLHLRPLPGFPEAVRAEIAHHGWPVGRAGAPWLSIGLPDGTTRDPTPGDYECMRAALLAVAALFERHGDHLARWASAPFLAERVTLPDTPGPGIVIASRHRDHFYAGPYLAATRPQENHPLDALAARLELIPPWRIDMRLLGCLALPSPNLPREAIARRILAEGSGPGTLGDQRRLLRRLDTLIRDVQTGEIVCSEMPLPEPLGAEAARAYARRRREEIEAFHQGAQEALGHVVPGRLEPFFEALRQLRAEAEDYERTGAPEDALDGLLLRLRLLGLTDRITQLILDLLCEAEELRQEVEVRTPVRVGAKVGRNAPCPCGSGKKFKKCCGHPARVH